MPKIFYGWILVGVAWLIYGFGISPGYYSWGQFAEPVIDELAFTRGDIGLIFGVFTFMYSGIGPVVGAVISRWGLRASMTVGSLLAAVGFLLVRQADSMWEFILYYGVIAGVGIGLSTILPSQTLATNWFNKYRARAVAIIMIAGGIVGRGVVKFDAWILDEHTWRDGWLVIAGISLLVALLAVVFIRNSPEEMGLHPDGRAQRTTEESLPVESQPLWTAMQALRTPQFAILCVAGVAYAVPWGVVVAHGALHLRDLGFERALAASILGTMILISIAGRLAGSLSDWVAPEKVLGSALLLEAAGVAGLLFATTPGLAYASTIAIGLGFGASYISIVLVFSKFFGRAAFAKTAGTRILITGIFGSLAPWLTGLVFDSTGSYQPAFIAIVAISLAGAVGSLMVKAPAAPIVAAPAAA